MAQQLYGTGTNGPEAVRVASTFKNAVRAAVGAAGSLTVWTPAAGKKIRLLWFSVTASAATVLTLKLGAEVLWEGDFAAAGHAEVLLPLNGGQVGAVDAALTLASSAAATIGGSASGTEEN